jgi:hypothetical protein
MTYGRSMLCVSCRDFSSKDEKLGFLEELEEPKSAAIMAGDKMQLPTSFVFLKKKRKAKKRTLFRFAYRLFFLSRPNSVMRPQ